MVKFATTQVIGPCPGSDNEQLAGTIKENQLATIRECLNRQRPFGREDWQAEMATTFVLGSTLRPRGRPSLKTTSLFYPF